jgi:hypothetical protein
LSKFAAVCGYFNPCGYKSRRRNYDAFRKNMERSGATVLTVELVFDPEGKSDLGPHGDVLVVAGGDVMWQRERLVQIGIDHLLDAGYDALAWVDADISFESDRWHENILRALQRHDCVQAFETLVSHFSDCNLVRPSTMKDARSVAHGGGWAATSAFWRRVGVYQHCILGGADSVMVSTFRQYREHGASEFTWPRTNPIMGPMNQAMRTHVTAWARKSWAPWSVGYVAGQSAHLLPHGARKRRYYVERWQILSNYNPSTDVAIAKSGALRWASNKSPLKDNVRRYFMMRREEE